MIPKGKILRVKQGYNPNSSSIGSIIFSMSAAIIPAAAVFGLVAGILSTAILEYAGKQHRGGAAADEEPSPDGGDTDAP